MKALSFLALHEEPQAAAIASYSPAVLSTIHGSDEQNGGSAGLTDFERLEQAISTPWRSPASGRRRRPIASATPCWAASRPRDSLIANPRYSLSHEVAENDIPCPGPQVHHRRRRSTDRGEAPLLPMAGQRCRHPCCATSPPGSNPSSLFVRAAKTHSRRRKATSRTSATSDRGPERSSAAASPRNVPHLQSRAPRTVDRVEISSPAVISADQVLPSRNLRAPPFR
jgi:hypothetical protein